MRRAACAVGLAGLLTLQLGACVLPLPLTIASTAIDIVLTVATGKSKSDYLLSFVMQQDCAMFRIIEGEEICLAEPEEIPNAIPDGLYARVVDPLTGEAAVGQVIKAQPVYSYADMPQGAPSGAPMQAIDQKLPPGLVIGAANGVAAEPGGNAGGAEIPMTLP